MFVCRYCFSRVSRRYMKETGFWASCTMRPQPSILSTNFGPEDTQTPLHKSRPS